MNQKHIIPLSKGGKNDQSNLNLGAARGAAPGGKKA